MRIECLRIRPNGTKVQFGDAEYHFAPSETDPRHIADVTNAGHIKALLAIEAYRIADEAVAGMLAESNALPTPAPADGTSKPLGDMTDDELRSLYTKTFGAPAGRRKRATLIAELAPKYPA